ncbi:hypothetical protein [Spelaeicoccus albus]|uniref:Uncharacterized protein n=2 Tax=Spelaeicoccus albus TaxID=1280376 RepID=A0A7Z0AA90_9MICO|nr:hypothetical protein [Spelaeicoccus albus]NYI67172.1 hypothetical protein [Spelaeicoccus albus]
MANIQPSASMTARPEQTRQDARPASRPDLLVGKAHGKDVAANGMVMGIAAIAWFGWAHQAEMAALQVPLAFGMAAGLALGIVCFTARRRLGGQSVHETNTKRANTVYYAAVGFEVVFAFGGAITLGKLEHPEYIIAWIMAVMGIHFLPLARLYRIRELTLTGALCIVAGAVGAITGLTGFLAPAVIAGVGGGAVLLATGIVCAARLRRAW